MLAILFPAIDPVAIQIGPLAIRWYALAYLIGFVAGWRYCIYLARKDDRPPRVQADIPLSDATTISTSRSPDTCCIVTLSWTLDEAA